MSNDVTLRTSTPAHDPQPGDVTAHITGLAEPLLDWLPSTDDVGAILRGRTRDPNGRLQAVFTATTDPTADQAAQVTASAAEEVASALPNPLPEAQGDDPDALRKAYRRVVAFLAAANIELGYPTTRGGLDRYDRLLTRYKDALKRLVEAASEAGAGGGGEAIGSPPPSPLWSFPDAPSVVPDHDTW